MRWKKEDDSYVSQEKACSYKIKTNISNKMKCIQQDNTIQGKFLLKFEGNEKVKYFYKLVLCNFIIQQQNLGKRQIKTEI